MTFPKLIQKTIQKLIRVTLAIAPVGVSLGLILCHLLFAPVALADAGRFINSPDYQAVTQEISQLLESRASLKPGENAATVNQKLIDLQNQKYILETAEERASCRNRTGKTLGVYLQSKKAAAEVPPTLYYLANGETTSDDFTCAGVYLPATTQVAFSLVEPAITLQEPLVLKIVEGTQLVINANPDTNTLELNLPPAKVIKPGQGDFEIPLLAQADIDAQKPNAPED